MATLDYHSFQERELVFDVFLVLKYSKGAAVLPDLATVSHPSLIL
jgi:hypothetical protein